ncbi:crotonase/enoyl-CoA hydratase family protein [Sphingomonas profundi]|uniref:crotonase/enoyl-CoA hydratase family protein n=1 Tax=Alterirhizorhabdus profundi TaxID=2681549 RepID=UPI0012E98D6C|nr:crotonase/enoyl-CoA hydratase family protein [Sphingomonas profundi]
MTDELLCESEDGVALVTLNRPDTRNPISDQPMIDALVALMQRLDADEAVRAIVLTGAGSAFSTGGNLREMAAGTGLHDPLPARTRSNYRHGIQRIPLAFEALETPVIAAVNGPAVGAGCDLACMCDIRIAGTAARFAESFVKVGLVPGDGGAWLLPRIVGFAKACELALTGDTIDAAAALACGLVSEVVPDAALIGHARALAGRIAANPPHAVRMTKRLLRQGRTVDLATALEAAAAMQALCHATDEHRDAVAAFLSRGKAG